MTAREFWNWFRSNEDRLWNLQDGNDPVLDEMQAELTKYRQGLYVEVSDEEDGVREIIIHTAGKKALFKDVEALVNAAPSIERWSVIALKPPRGFDFVFDSEGLTLEPSQMWFRSLSTSGDRSALGLLIFVPLSKVDQAVKDAVVTVLETGLGERLAADIEHIEVEPVPADREQLLPLDALLDYVRKFRERHIAPAPGIH